MEILNRLKSKVSILIRKILKKKFSVLMRKNLKKKFSVLMRKANMLVVAYLIFI